MSYQRPSGTTRFALRSAAKLALPSAWIDEELNSIYTTLNSMTLSVNSSEWPLFNATATYIDASNFSCSGDQTGIFNVKRRIKANLSGTYVYSKISTATYNSGTGITTVTLADAVLTSSLSQIFYSIFDSVNNSVSAELIACDAVGELISTEVQAAIAEIEAKKLKETDILGDFVISGLLGTAPSNSLSMTTPAGKIWQSGVRISSAGFTQTYTASRDTYDSINNTGVITHTEVANGAAAPTLPANSQWIQKVVTDATKIMTVTDLRSIASMLPAGEILSDCVVSGLLATAPASGFSMTTPGGVFCIKGKRTVKAPSDADLTHTYTASKDTYVDIDSSGNIANVEVSNNDYAVNGLLSSVINAGSLLQSIPGGSAWVKGKYVVSPPVQYTYSANSDTYDSIDNTGTITHTAVSNGAAQPSLPANSMWLQKVVTNATQATAFTDLRNLTTNEPAVTINSIRIQKVVADSSKIQSVIDYRTLNKPILSRPAYRGALVRRTTNQTLTVGGYTTVDWEAEVRDTDNIHNASLNTTRLTVPAGASKVRLRFNGYIAHGGTPNGTAAAYLYKNGGSNYVGACCDIIYPSQYSGAIFTPLIVSPVLDVIPGDFFEIVVVGASGSTSATLRGGGDGTYSAFFEMDIVE